MKWLSIDTDIFTDGKIKSLLQQKGPPGYLVYNFILARVAKNIDIDNDENGYLDIGNGDYPENEIAWELHLEPDQVKEILDILAKLELISPDKWEDKRVYVPKLLEREQTDLYLRRQEGGRKGGRRSPSSSPSRSPSTDIDIDVDKDLDLDNIKHIFSHWKEKSETITHRKLTGKMKSAINARLNDGYTIDELKEAIDNYNMVVKSDDYFFSYDNWSLNEFLSRGEGEQVEKFLENPDAYLKDDKKNSDKSTPSKYKPDYGDLRARGLTDEEANRKIEEWERIHETK